ncbi:monooxygenase 2-like [Cornus florida]|uniref:monooxygenase 2-like n=1 Tax=Cornus florida TaxID=4283 RepID=UPI00289EEEEC|nr:monooxygenase 2-like [Cornus florida]
MEVVEDIVIVGGGIAGLTTSLGLHRLGIRSIVLESSDSLRVTGFAFTTWTNAWRALDAIGIGQSLRQQHQLLYGIKTNSITSGLPTSEVSFETKGAGYGAPNEVRCVKRKLLVETLEKELPSGTVKYSSKVVSIEDSGYFKLLHLADGTILKAKVLIGCDGVNSVVAKWLGFKKPAFVGRSAIRGYADFKTSHDFEPRFIQCAGKGVRIGFLPCDDNTIDWFCTYIPTPKDKEMEENPSMMKEFVLSKLEKLPDQVKAVVEVTELDSIINSPLRFRLPWEILWGNTSKGNVCVAGDAFHPMTPDIGQGGCAALEDGVVLARCLAEALCKRKSSRRTEVKIAEEEDERERIEMGLKKFAEERKWRAFKLISTAYMVGFILQNDGMVISFLRDKVLAAFLSRLLLKRADFDCGKLCIS